ncbi:IS66 family transposase, partial [Shewanella sp. SG41-4]|nr:IS66 family transposase [Shewanella sp. SG41-4]
MTDLPDDIAQLKAMLLQLQQENDAQKVLLQAKQEQVSELQTQIELLIEQLNLSKSKRFSSQSEKVAKGTFNEAEQQHALPNVNKS